MPDNVVSVPRTSRTPADSYRFEFCHTARLLCTLPRHHVAIFALQRSGSGVREAGDDEAGLARVPAPEAVAPSAALLDLHKSPFEFRVLEARAFYPASGPGGGRPAVPAAGSPPRLPPTPAHCPAPHQVVLDTVCTRLDDAVSSLERSAHEASRALLRSRRSAKGPLEEMKRVKGELSRLEARLRTVWEQLQSFLEDEGNMRELYLTRKARVRAAFAAEWAARAPEATAEEGGAGPQPQGAAAASMAAGRALSMIAAPSVFGGRAESLRLGFAPFRGGALGARLLLPPRAGLEPEDERVDAEARQLPPKAASMWKGTQ